MSTAQYFNCRIIALAMCSIAQSTQMRCGLCQHEGEFVNKHGTSMHRKGSQDEMGGLWVVAVSGPLWFH